MKLLKIGSMIGVIAVLFLSVQVGFTANKEQIEASPTRDQFEVICQQWGYYDVTEGEQDIIISIPEALHVSVPTIHSLESKNIMKVCVTVQYY